MLDKELFEKLIDTLLDSGADFCDVYAEESGYNQVTSDDRKINTSRSIQSGVGLRAVKDFRTFYTVCQDTRPETLLEAAKYLASGIRLEGTARSSNIRLEFGPKFDPVGNTDADPSVASIETKHAIVLEAQETAWTYSDKVTQVTARFDDFYRDITIASSECDNIIRQVQIIHSLKFSFCQINLRSLLRYNLERLKINL